MKTRAKLYLHIGMHKTGSTAIQYYTSKNRTRFSQLGLLVPKAGRPITAPHGHHNLAWAFYRDRSLIGQWAALKDEIKRSGNTTVLLSSEDFGRCQEDHILEIKRLLQAFDVTIVIYIRDQVGLAESMYRTEVLHFGNTQTLDEYLDQEVASYNCKTLLKHWDSVFGRDNIICRAYQNCKGMPIDVIKDYSQLIGINKGLFGYIPKRTINHGLPAIAIETVRALRLANGSEERISDFYLWCLSSDLITSLNYTFLTNEDYERRMEQFIADNKWVQTNFFPQLDNALFSSSRQTDWPDSSASNGFTPQATFGLIRDYFKQQKERLPPSFFTSLDKLFQRFESNSL